MKSWKSGIKSVSVIITIVIFLSSTLTYAEDLKTTTDYSTTASFVVEPYYLGMNTLYAQASDNIQATGTTESSGGSDINWHKVLGWSTLGMAVVTIGSGAVISHNGHCELAGVTTGLAAATCITGYYNYGGIISITDGDWKYNTHAIMGTLATIGFIATVALAGEDGSGAHVATGVASGTAFAITIGVLYF